MTPLEIFAVAVLVIWLAVLTLVVLLLVRQVALISVRLSAPLEAGDATHVVADGPEIGSPIPEQLASVLPLRQGEELTVLVLSASCKPCQELAIELNSWTRTEPVAALVDGDHGNADNITQLLPSNFIVIEDPAASSIIESIAVKNRPFAFAVKDGAFTRKSHVRGEQDVVSLVELSSRQANGSTRREELVHDT